MKKLELKLSNCYGINSIVAYFDYSKCNANIIYVELPLFDRTRF